MRVLQYTALAEGAAIPVREVSVHRQMATDLPGRVVFGSEAERGGYGHLLTRYLLPEDFRQLLTDSDAVSFTLDASTALFPWEMALVQGRRGGGALGTLLPVARQFRSALAKSFGVPPPLNNELKVLIIADPSSADMPLSGARAEGREVVRAFGRAKRAWGDRLKLEVTVRMGRGRSGPARRLQRTLAEVRELGPWVLSAKPCDPLELLLLLVADGFDVVHFAGHGTFEPKTGRMGWVFNRMCVWSAEEVFGVRRVPRLVFANACHSAELTGAQQQGEQVAAGRGVLRPRRPELHRHRLGGQR